MTDAPMTDAPMTDAPVTDAPMTDAPVTILRRAIRSTLLADATLVALLGGGKVFNDTPSGTQAPYVVFADTLWRDWSATLSRGAEQIFVLSVWSTQRGVREALDIAERIIALLDEAPLTLSGAQLVDLRFLQLETKRDGAGRFARANLRFRATTEPM